jgi:hypothetical protein
VAARKHCRIKTKDYSAQPEGLTEGSSHKQIPINNETCKQAKERVEM